MAASTIIGPWRTILVSLCLIVGEMALPAGAQAQYNQTSFPVPPGIVVMPWITTGADANTYISSTPPTAAFLASAPADVVLTTAPTQYVRVYTLGVTAPNRAFIAGSNAIRGLTPEQIRNVLALPYLPTNVTLVEIPAGTCVMTGTGAPVNGNFPANPPAIPTPGPWGNGGAYQSYIIGTSSSPNCASPQYLPASDYINQQPLGTYALAYLPNAGTGNTAAVARALDHATLPGLFTDMDGIYNTLDSLNFGNPVPLQQALAQLDGEVYADTATAAITAGQLFLGAVRDQMHSPAIAIGKLLPWLTAVGGAGSESGNGDSHDVAFGIGGIAGGFDYWIDPTLRVGVGLGYTRGGFVTNGIPGSGGYDSFSAAPYIRFAPSAWYIEGTVGYAYNDASVNRDIDFASNYWSVARRASGSPSGSGFLSRVETGYRHDLSAAVAVTPFVALQSIVFAQNRFTESGASAADLHVASNTTGSAQSILGTEIAYAMPVGLQTPLQISGRLGWGHEFLATRRDSTAYLDGTPGAAFTVNGAPAPRNVAVFGLGVSLSLGSGQVFLRYAGSAGASSSVQGGTLGARWTF